MIARALAGAALAAAVAALARRSGSLSRGGAVAAAVLGAVSIAAGWTWALLLLAFFASSTALTRLFAAEKARRTADIVAKGGERDAAQVLANGGVFAAAAALWLVRPSDAWLAVGAGAIAAAAADTWATELGVMSPSRPRLITTGRRVPAGTSGAVSAYGMLASVAGAAFIALLVALAGWPRSVATGALLGGIAGALADSVVGALWQARRRCVRCGQATERRAHGCGGDTEHAGGLAWLDNDAVNLMACAAGGAAALIVYQWGRQP